jgi:thiamine pyrophosphokinase
MFIVIFTGGTAPEPAICEKFFSDLNFASKNEPPFVIAADSGIHTLEKFIDFFPDIDFSPDIILGDWDSLGDKKILEKYPKEIIQNHIPDKDFTDTELALEEAIKYSSKNSECVHKIILLGAGGGERIDHLIAVFDLFATKSHPDIWISGNQFLYFLGEKTCAEIYDLSACDMVSVLRTSESRSGGKISSRGLLWEYGLFRKEGVPSISNRISPEFFHGKKPVSVNVYEGSFVLAVPFSAKVLLRNLP